MTSMIAQLSTSTSERQPTIAWRWLISWVFVCVLSLSGTTVRAQGSEIELRIDPLSTIDRQFMSSQRRAVEHLANQLGRSLTGQPERDIDTLQEIISRNLVERDDQLALQGMGVVFGDLLGKTLSMDWVVYRDRAGRSRALRYRQSDTYLFPVTMISRRVEAGSDRSLIDLYKTTVSNTRKRLPGARWLN